VWIAGGLCATYLLIGAFASAVLCNTDALATGDAIFEAFSALGTVGLTRDVTPQLSSLGKWIVIALMFAGRVLFPTLVLRATRGRPWDAEAVPWT
jgi:trk system potassium uptake protein TrkH